MTPEQEKIYKDFLEYFNKVQRPVFLGELFKYNIINSGFVIENLPSTISKINLYGFDRGYLDKHSLYLPKKDLHNFIHKNIQILFKLEDEIYFEKIYETLAKSFLAYYNLYENYEKKSLIVTIHKNQANLCIDFFNNEIAFFGKVDQSVIARYLDMAKSSLICFLNESPDKYRIIFKNEKIFVGDVKKYSKRNEKIFINFILRIFEDNQVRNFVINDIILELNIILDEELKPINYSVIETVIKNNPFYFNFDEQNKIVSILSEEEVIEKIKEHFKNNQKSINEFGDVIKESGFIALTFIGKNFPFSEAAEYVKTRPIIFVDSILDKTDLETYISFSDEDLINPEVPDTKYLKIFNLEDDVKNWIVENCYISFFPYDRDRVKFLFPKLIEKLSPVLNLSSSPNNLFEYTLKQKIYEYLSSKGLLEENG